MKENEKYYRLRVGKGPAGKKKYYRNGAAERKKGKDKHCERRNVRKKGEERKKIFGQ